MDAERSRRIHNSARIERALLVYPSQLYCPDPDTAPIVMKTQLVKLYSALVNRGITVDIVDLELEFGRPRDEAERRVFLRAAESRLARGRYDIVGVSCYTSLSYLATIDVCAIAARLYPVATIVVGGYHCLGNAEDFEPYAEIDFIVRGCGLHFFADLLRGKDLPRICSYDGISPPPEPMRYVEYPYRYRRNPAVANVQLSRGCPFHCAFCCEPFVGNRRYASLDVDVALSAIDEVICRLNPSKVVIEDVLFGLNAAWRQRFLQALHKRGYPQIFWAEMRVDTASNDALAQLSMMNFDLTIGLESLSPHTLRSMNKANKPEHYIRAFERTLQSLHHHPVPTTYTIMLNYPGETWDSYDETMRRVEDAQSALGPQVFEFDFLEFSFYPGNETFAHFDRLSAEHGAEIGDRTWYKRRDGEMLRHAMCSVASRALARKVGADAMRTYFRQRVEAVTVKTRTRQPDRARLMRSWRVVEALRRRLPVLGPVDPYDPRPSPPAALQRRALVRLVAVHEQIARAFRRVIETPGAPSWWERNEAWHTAVDFICNAAEGPSARRLDESALERIEARAASVDLEPHRDAWALQHNPDKCLLSAI